jgi:hypothetical protein
MPARFLSIRVCEAALAAAVLAGCAHPGLVAAPQLGKALSAQAAKPPLTAALAAFTKEEGRKVQAKNVPMNEGRGAAELCVPLSPEEQTLLIQLYRLHPRAVPASEFPAGLLARTQAHLVTLHGFKLPKATRLSKERLATEMRTRVYRDGDGQTLSYESFVSGEDFSLYGKYDLQGRILKVDVETWTN